MEVGALIISLQADIARLQKDMDRANRTIDGAMRKVEMSARTAMRTVSGLVGGISFASFIKGVVDSEIQLQKLNNTLKFATGSASTAAKEMQFLRKTTADLGLEFNSAATAYGKLAASAKGTSLEGQKTRDVFEAVSKASVVMGLSADEASGALLAISQMISKGTVQSEELRGQLGERLPGAFQIAARAMGVTTQELGKMLQQGQIVSDDFLPKFAAELNKTLGDNADSAANSALANLNRLQNAWTQFKASAAESGIMTIVLKVAEGSTDALKWFDHFVFNKGELADIQKQNGLRDKLTEFEAMQKRSNQYPFLTSNAQKARIDKEIISLRRQLGLIKESDFQPANGMQDTSQIGPNLDVAPTAEDINEIHRRQQEQARAAKELADDNIAENKRINAEKLKDLQKQLDFEEDIRETEAKGQYENAEKARKQMEADEKYRRDFIMKRNQEISDEYLRTVREQNEKAQREYDRFYDRLSQSITDALFRGFESGKDFIQNFKDTLIRAFETLILQPKIDMIVRGSGIGALFGVPNVAGAGEITGSAGGIGGLSGIGSNLLTVGKGLINGISGVQGAITSSIENLGVMLATGNGGLLDSLGGFIGANAGTIGNVIPFAGAALQALTGNIKGAAFTAAGAAIGSVIPGLGTALGGAIGGALGGLFGGGKGHRSGAAVNGSYSNGVFTQGTVTKGSATKFNSAYVEPLTQLSSAFANQLGGFLGAMGLSDNLTTMASYKAKPKGSTRAMFGGTVNGVQFGYNDLKYDKKDKEAFSKFASEALGSIMVQAIQASSLSAGIKALFDGLTDRTQIGNMMTATVNLNSAQKQLEDRFGLTVDAAGRVSKATGEVGDQLSAFVNKLASSALAFKKPSEVLLETRANIQKGLNNSFGTVVQDAVWKTVTRQVEVGNGKPDFGADRFGNPFTQSGIIAKWWPVQKQFETVTEQVLTYVDRVIPKTVALPATLEEYDKLLKSINTTTAAGAKMFADIFSMRDQFVAYTQAIDSLKANVKSAIFPMLSASEQQAQMQADLAKLFNELNLQVPGSVQELIDLGKSIDYTTESGLDLAAAFPTLVQAFQQAKSATDGLISSLTQLNPDRFHTLVDLTRAQSYQRNGISLAKLPSYDVGTPFVPNDGPAMIHRGERILTAEENRQFSANNAEVATLLRQQIDDGRRMMTQVIIATQKAAKVLERFDNEGVPLSETDRSGTRITLDVHSV